MYVLKHIGIGSAVKFGAVFGIVFGLLFGIIVVVSLFSFIGFIAMPIIGLVLGAISGALCGALYAIIYDAITWIVGGVGFDMKNNVLIRIDLISYVKFIGVFDIIFGIILGLLRLLMPGGSTSTTSTILTASMVSGPVGIVIFIVLSIVEAVVLVLLYNFLAERIGGINIDISGNVLKSIGPMSLAKIGMVIFGVVFIIAAIIDVPILSSMHLPISMTTIVTTFIVGTIASFVISFIINLVSAWIYNKIAERFGGIAIDVEGATAATPNKASGGSG